MMFRISHTPIVLHFIHICVYLQNDSDSTDGDKIEEKCFRANIDGKTARFKLRREDWEKILIKKVPSGGRLLGGNWVKIFLRKVKEGNP